MSLEQKDRPAQLNQEGILSTFALFSLLDDPKTRQILVEARRVRPDFGPTHIKSLGALNSVLARDAHLGREYSLFLRHGIDPFGEDSHMLNTPVKIIYKVPTNARIDEDAEGNVEFEGASILDYHLNTKFRHHSSVDGLSLDPERDAYTRKRWVEDVRAALFHPDKSSLLSQSVVNDEFILGRLYDRRDEIPEEIATMARFRHLELTGWDLANEVEQDYL